MAAFRNGIKTVIIPADNNKDLEEIDQTVRKALQFVLVERADQVLSTALLPHAAPVAERQEPSPSPSVPVLPPVEGRPSARVSQ